MKIEITEQSIYEALESKVESAYRCWWAISERPDECGLFSFNEGALKARLEQIDSIVAAYNTVGAKCYLTKELVTFDYHMPTGICFASPSDMREDLPYMAFPIKAWREQFDMPRSEVSWFVDDDDDDE